MKVRELVKLALNTDLRFYNVDTLTNAYIDWNTTHVNLTELSKNAEVVSFSIDGEYCYNEIIDEWISVIYKERKQ